MSHSSSATSANSPNNRDFANDLGERAFLLGDTSYRSTAEDDLKYRIPKTPKEKVWHFMEYNRTINLFLMAMITISTVGFCMETVRRFKPWTLYFFIIECFVSIVFSAEYIIRFWSAPMSKYDFITSPMNIVDLCAILPFFVEMTYIYYEHMHGITIDPAMDLRTIRCLRLARLFKFGRYNSELSLVTSAFIRSYSSFLMLGFMLILALVFFSTLMYCVERGIWDEKLNCYVRNNFVLYGNFTESNCGPFQSIPHAFWWAITTMTTVGYGDTYPISIPGKIVGGVAMVAGILSVALPTTVLGVQFGDSYKALQDEREIKRMHDLLPDETEQASEYLNQVEFVAKTRMEIAKLMKELDIVTTKLHTPRDYTAREAMFKRMVKQSCENFEQFLLSIDQPATERLSKGGKRLSSA